MISVQMNDAAADLLAPADGAVAAAGELAPGLRELLARGIERRGEVVVFVRDAVATDRDVPGRAFDLTGWECDASSFHLDDVVPVTVNLVDHRPEISRSDQRLMLQHGLPFAIAVARQAAVLTRPAHIRCIVGVNETNGTFRFHMVRPGEPAGADPALDGYLDPMITVDSPGVRGGAPA